jgi:hypothetical protein
MLSVTLTRTKPCPSNLNIFVPELWCFAALRLTTENRSTVQMFKSSGSPPPRRLFNQFWIFVFGSFDLAQNQFWIEPRVAPLLGLLQLTPKVRSNRIGVILSMFSNCENAISIAAIEELSHRQSRLCRLLSDPIVFTVVSLRARR